MIDMLSMPFMQRAAAAGIIIGFIASFYGVFIVQRKMSFLGSGLGHAAFGGVALGLLLGMEPLWIAVPFTIIISVLITYIKERTKLAADTAIGILFSVSVALGIIFISMKEDYSSDAFNYLFGSILSVFPSDLIAASVIAVLTILAFILYWGRWAYATFDTELAVSDRVRVSHDDYVLSVLIALTIVVSIKLVGIILIASFLVIPAAAARLIAGSFIKMTIYSIIIGVSSSIIGLFISFLLDMPPGAVIIIVQAFIFLLAVLKKQLTD